MLMNLAEAFSQTFEQLLVFCRVARFEQLKRKPVGRISGASKMYLREIEAGRRSEREMQQHFAYIESMTEIVPLDGGLALKAGETDFLMKKRIRGWPLADSVI
jgi:hypothetical protein